MQLHFVFNGLYLKLVIIINMVVLSIMRQESVYDNNFLISGHIVQKNSNFKIYLV